MKLPTLYYVADPSKGGPIHLYRDCSYLRTTPCFCPELRRTRAWWLCDRCEFRQRWGKSA